MHKSWPGNRPHLPNHADLYSRTGWSSTMSNAERWERERAIEIRAAAKEVGVVSRNDDEEYEVVWHG